MRRIATPLLIALIVLGCGLMRAGEPVKLLTGWGPFPGGGTCYTNFAVGPLVPDAEFGTAIADESAMGDVTATTPVMWRPGFYAMRLDSQVVVYDAAGKEVARTGARYRIAGGYWSETITPTKENHYAFSGPRVFLACDSVNPV